MITTHISKNYIITAFLTIKSILQIKENYLTISEYNAFRNHLIEKIKEKDIDALIMDDYLDEVYFEYNKEHTYIVLKEPNNLGLEKAKWRYQGYLPIEIISFLYSTDIIEMGYKVIIEEKERRINALKNEIKEISENYKSNLTLQRTKNSY